MGGIKARAGGRAGFPSLLSSCSQEPLCQAGKGALKAGRGSKRQANEFGLCRHLRIYLPLQALFLFPLLPIHPHTWPNLGPFTHRKTGLGRGSSLLETSSFRREGVGLMKGIVLRQRGPQALNSHSSMGQTLRFCVVGVLGPRASCAGDCTHGATECPNGQDGRAELQL